MGCIPHEILLISDVQEAEALRDALLDSSDCRFSVTWVRSCADGLRRLAVHGTRAGSPRDRGIGADGLIAVLVDLFLPDSQGIGTFTRVAGAAPHVPILVLSAPQHEHFAQLAVQQGAHDYLLTGHMDRYLWPKAVRSMIERAQNAEALHEEHERARVALDFVGDAVVGCDLLGRVTYLNSVAEKMTGWSFADALGRPMAEILNLFDGTSGLAVRNPMDLALLGNGGAQPPSFVLLRRDGRELRIEDSVAPIHDTRGEVTGAVLVLHDVSAARSVAHRMSYMAHHDSLTGLPNRVLLNDRLTLAISLAQRHRRKLAVLFLDVDRFKHVNDSLGHGIGDRLLQSVAARLLGCVRGSDTVGRQGGDEFVIVLSEITHAQDAAISADKMIRALSEPHCIDQHELRVTCSIGIVVYPDDGTQTDVLMKHADYAMYHAKEKGRNNYQFFEPDLNVRVVERQLLGNGLRAAIAARELVLHYQPKIDLASGAILGAEALLRWRHPERGLILPLQFLPFADGCGLIVPIGRWVLKEACRQVRAWQVAGLGALRVAINVSATELRDKEFVPCVRSVLEETGLSARDLELELTESVLMQDVNWTEEVLRALKSLSVQLALDDFGTGYSGLSHLKRFPIDILKIDRSFVHDLKTGSNSGSIVSAVVGMGKNLGMQVVAEGVESSEQLVCLQDLSCPLGQGYYFSRPVAAGAFARLCGQELTHSAVA